MYIKMLVNCWRTNRETFQFDGRLPKSGFCFVFVFICIWIFSIKSIKFIDSNSIADSIASWWRSSIILVSSNGQTRWNWQIQTHKCKKNNELSQWSFDAMEYCHFDRKCTQLVLVNAVIVVQWFGFVGCYLISDTLDRSTRDFIWPPWFFQQTDGYY